MLVYIKGKFHPSIKKSELKRIDVVDSEIKKMLREIEILGEKG